MKKYKVVAPICYCGKVYNIGEVFELSVESNDYFNYWKGRMRDGEIEEVKEEENAQVESGENLAQENELPVQFENNKNLKNSKVK